jgi:LPXTG-motif cell wall-anchored protein
MNNLAHDPQLHPTHHSIERNTMSFKEKKGESLLFSRFAIGAVAIAFGVGAIVADPTPDVSQAHTADMEAVAVCETNGTYTVTFTLTLGNVPSGATALVEARTGSTSLQNNWDRSSFNDWENILADVPSTQTTVSWIRSLPGTTTGNGPWEYAVTTWSNTTVVRSDAQAVGLTGDCTPSPTPVTTSVVFTPGDCTSEGIAVLSVSDQYTWAESGDATARIFTASPVGNVTLTQSVFGPYNLSQLPADDPRCGGDEVPVLPETGADMSAPALIGGGMLLTGTLLLLYRRCVV